MTYTEKANDAMTIFNQIQYNRKAMALLPIDSKEWKTLKAVQDELFRRWDEVSK